MKVAVVGAGLAGLLAASELKRRGADVTVFEASSRVGGVANTVERSGYRLEPAVASFMLPHPVLSPIFHAAKTPVIEHSGSDRRLISGGEGFTEIPRTPQAFLTSSILGPVAKLRVLAEPWVRSTTHPTETLEDFCTRRLGSAAGSTAASLAAAGVFGGHPRLIDAAAFAPLIALEAAHGSLLRGMAKRRSQAGGSRPGLHFPEHGMAELAADLARFVGDVRLDSPIESIERTGGQVRVAGISADAVVLTCPASVAPMFNGDQIVIDITEAAAIAVVFLGGTCDAMALPEGFGLLSDGRSQTEILGVVLENGPNSAPPGHRLVKVLIGGSRYAVADRSDDHLVDLTVDRIKRIFEADITASFTHVERRIIPQYRPGHMSKVASLVLPPAIKVGGWTQRGIGLGSLAADARRIADEIIGEREGI